jgi:hypothetical protein
MPCLGRCPVYTWSYTTSASMRYGWAAKLVASQLAMVLAYRSEVELDHIARAEEVPAQTTLTTHMCMVGVRGADSSS